jgi:surface antigen
MSLRVSLIGPAALALAALALAGCAANPTEGQLWGTGAGGVVGGGIGRAAAIGTHAPWAFSGVGVLAGAALGYAIGDHVDPPAQRMWAAATIEAAETGRPNEPVRWESHGHRGSVTVVGEGWTDAGGRACRALHQEASRLRDSEANYTREVTACRHADGTWEVAESAKDAES